MFRFLFRLVLLALLLLFLVFIFVPNLISTKWGKETFFKAYKSMTGNTLTADTFDVSWWKGQNFENLTLVYPKEKTTLTASHIKTDATLWQIVFYKDLGHITVKDGTVKFLGHGFDPIELQNVNLMGDLKSQKGTFDLSSTVNQGSIALSVQVSFEQTAATLNLTKPAKVSLILSPDGYASLDHWLNKTPTPFKLNQPAVIKSSINSLTLPHSQGKLAFSDLLCQADLSIDTLDFSGKTPEMGRQISTQLSQVQLKIDHSTKASPIAFAITASGAPHGSLSVKGTLDPSTGSMDLNSRLDQFPSSALDVFSRSFGKSSVSMATVLGPHVNLTATSSLSHWNGPVKVQINSPNIQASLDGVMASGILHLNDAFKMQMTLTPDLSRVLLNSVNPLSLRAITAQTPITLEIPAQGFSYPVYPSNDSQINIASGRLDLGKLHCHNEGNVNITLGLLKLSQFSQNQDLELWFAPLDFHIVDGDMDCERTEILIANTYQVCVWGGLDFPKKKVDMVLGLTAGCLRTAFGIKDLPDTYVLQIPMKGKMDNVKINTGKATAKIAALLLWQQKDLSGAFGKSSGGAALGKFLNKIGPLPDGDSKAPPAKRPFPWESGF